MNTKRDLSKNRQERILDAAEILFSKHGFDGVTVRQISKMANVDIALPHYYFKSKDGLFRATFLRRSGILNIERAQELKSVLEKAGDNPARLEDIIGAFLWPICRAQENHDPGWSAYCRLVALVNNSSVWGKRLMTDNFDVLVCQFIGALKNAMPDAEEKDIYWCYHFLSGALTLTMADTGRIDNLSGGICHSDNVGEAYERMVDFFAEGFRRICLKN